VPVPSRPLAFVSDRQLAISFPVHHSGKLLLRALLCVHTCGDSEGGATCAQFRDDGGNLLDQRQGIAWSGLSATFDVTAGHRYGLTVSVCESQPPPSNLIKAYFVGVTRPN
jgi:hypothetical protein